MSEHAIDLSAVQVHASQAACLQFPVTATLNSFSLVPGTMTLRSTGTEGWPDVDIGGATQRATLWVFVKIGGQWHAAGLERLRPDQVNGTKPEAHVGPRDIETIIGRGWAGKPEFGAMHGFNPRSGDPVGIMIVSGSTRLDHRPTVSQRSNILVVAWPSVAGADPCQMLWDERQPVAVPAVPEPVPIGQPPTGTAQVVSDLSSLEAELSQLSRRLTECATTAEKLSQKLRTAQAQLASSIDA